MGGGSGHALASTPSASSRSAPHASPIEAAPHRVSGERPRPPERLPLPFDEPLGILARPQRLLQVGEPERPAAVVGWKGLCVSGSGSSVPPRLSYVAHRRPLSIHRSAGVSRYHSAHSPSYRSSGSSRRLASPPAPPGSSDPGAGEWPAGRCAVSSVIGADGGAGRRGSAEPPGAERGALPCAGDGGPRPRIPPENVAPVERAVPVTSPHSGSVPSPRIPTYAA